jgi:hypothetical protein
MAETTDTEPRAPAEMIDTTPDVASVNLLVKRSGCSVREAEITLGGRTRDEQRAIAALGKADLKRVRTHDINAALELLRDAGVEHDAPCPFGAPRNGPTPTWGDVVARMVCAGESVSIPALLKRVAA